MVQESLRFSSSAAQKYLPIQDYGVIGNLHTVALVGKNGSIDWCCLPRFDSPSVFGALLDAEKGGFFRIAPLETPEMSYKQLYLPDTNILITRFLTLDGVGEITDFMPIGHFRDEEAHQHYIMRYVRVVRGSLAFKMTCRPAFNYARDLHDIYLSKEGAIFRNNSLILALSCAVPLEEDRQGGVCGRFVLREEEARFFRLESASGHDVQPHSHGKDYYKDEFLETKRYWQGWVARCQYQGRWREMVVRSALVLKLLTYQPTGAIVAAPTTSLPETLGGERNWDYRYTWLRDAAFTIYGLLILGFLDEAKAFMDWLEARCCGLPDGSALQPMYSIDGQSALVEERLEHLEGYRQSRPVRIGNAAYKQDQLDIYGELIDSIYILNRHKDISYDLWNSVCRLLDWLKLHWRDPDESIWEVRGGKKCFVHSRVMNWVAFDRALRIARHRGLPAPFVDWTTTSSQIYREVMERGWNEKVGSFVQYYGSDAIDASALLMVLTRFAGPADYRMLSTIERIRRELTSDLHIYRYDPRQAADDGFGSREGTFNMCSFWMVEALARADYLEDARLLLEKMLTYANHVGLYAEEIGVTGEALGNFPQAFTHLSLISACYNMDRALNGNLNG
ncbi:MAG TPA: glycoside hydrolase family 15 protein [Ktedonobacteraceae bacterium]|nr:glycoside hydrolase family 15 protein [Ktedonobacteraceae bacterium]